MARAGFCSRCGANTWVNEDGSCSGGHPAENVSGLYEAGEPQPVQVAPNKDRTSLVVVIVAVVVASLFLCGILSAIAVPVFLSASGNAELKSCYANERTVEGASLTYLAIDENATLVSDWDELMSMLVPTVLNSEPTCPAGGAYSVTSTDASAKVDCSVHGNYEDEYADR